MQRPMPSIENMLSYTIADSAGNAVGIINSVHHDEQTGKPEWLTVDLDVAGGDVRFVPAVDLVLDHELRAVVTPYEKKLIEAAPQYQGGHILSDFEEQNLFAHYSLTYTAVIQDAGLLLQPGESSPQPNELLTSMIDD